MLALTTEILERKVVEDSAGNQFPLHSHTDHEKGEFLQSLIRQTSAETCVEIGLAYGISALFICETLAERVRPRFISIDPFQGEWKEIGLLNLKRADFLRFTEFHREFSRDVLPRLLRDGERIDFGFIDADKSFENNLHDAMYLTCLLRVGGILAFDDCECPGLRDVVRLLAQWPHLKVVANLGASSSRPAKRTASRVSKWMPRAEKIFRDDFLCLDDALSVKASCVALEKIAEDPRPWGWQIKP